MAEVLALSALEHLLALTPSLLLAPAVTQR